jgi:hypothetical protein
MHFLLGAAGLLALVTLAYGEDAARVVARVALIGVPVLVVIILLCASMGVFKGL